ncbi:hypothetical protein C8J57DRAFT_1218594 [Mycena rebaudengoi]|nr:hypothetical protein C8J57DRAFT_1218594 [Mycena rebaudengoi]
MGLESVILPALEMGSFFDSGREDAKGILSFKGCIEHLILVPPRVLTESKNKPDIETVIKKTGMYILLKASAYLASANAWFLRRPRHCQGMRRGSGVGDAVSAVLRECVEEARGGGGEVVEAEAEAGADADAEWGGRGDTREDRESSSLRLRQRTAGAEDSACRAWRTRKFRHCTFERGVGNGGFAGDGAGQSRRGGRCGALGAEDGLRVALRDVLGPVALRQLWEVGTLEAEAE